MTTPSRLPKPPAPQEYADADPRDDLIRRLAHKLNESEGAICGEWCSTRWPDCDDPGHQWVKALLAEASEHGWKRRDV